MDAISGNSVGIKGAIGTIKGACPDFFIFLELCPSCRMVRSCFKKTILTRTTAKYYDLVTRRPIQMCAIEDSLTI